jgi:hypothetical protein
MRRAMLSAIGLLFVCAGTALPQPLPAQTDAGDPLRHGLIPAAVNAWRARHPVSSDTPEPEYREGKPEERPSNGASPEVDPRAVIPEPSLTAQPSVYGHRTTHEATAYPYLLWARAEYLVWWMKDGPAPPPLITTGPQANLNAGALGDPETAILFGNSPLGYGTFSGGRWTVGTWCDLCQERGFEVTGFLFEQRSIKFGETSDLAGNPVLARPFTNAQTTFNQAVFVTFPQRFAGGVGVSSASQLWGVEANVLDNTLHGGVPLRTYVFPWGEWRLELQAGFRFLELHENLNIDQLSFLLSQGIASFAGQTIFPPNALFLHDGFGTRNRFFGGQVGLHTQWSHGCWFVDVLGKLALGDTHEITNINGSTTLIPPNAPPITVNGGLVATSTNIGHYTHDHFGVVSELGFTVGYQWGPCVRLFTGYTFLFWDRVVRPGNQVDLAVNLTQVPIHPTFGPLVGPAQPAFSNAQSSFWAQGMSFGIEMRY